MLLCPHFAPAFCLCHQWTVSALRWTPPFVPRSTAVTIVSLAPASMDFLMSASHVNYSFFGQTTGLNNKILISLSRMSSSQQQASIANSLPVPFRLPSFPPLHPCSATSCQSFEVYGTLLFDIAAVPHCVWAMRQIRTVLLHMHVCRVAKVIPVWLLISLERTYVLTEGTNFQKFFITLWLGKYFVERPPFPKVKTQFRSGVEGII